MSDMIIQCLWSRRRLQCVTILSTISQRGPTDAEIAVSSAENSDKSKVAPIQSGAGDKNVLHASLTARNSAVPINFLPSWLILLPSPRRCLQCPPTSGSMVLVDLVCLQHALFETPELFCISFILPRTSSSTDQVTMTAGHFYWLVVCFAPACCIGRYTPLAVETWLNIKSTNPPSVR